MKLQPRKNTHKDLLFVLLFVVMGLSLLMGVSSNTASGVSNSEIIEQPIKGNIETISYYSAIDSCHTGVSCLMASGKRAYVGAVACPRDLELGTKVEIDGIEYTCEDRTSLTYDGRYDIFLGYEEKDYHQALENGIDKLNVIIYD